MSEDTQALSLKNALPPSPSLADGTDAAVESSAQSTAQSAADLPDLPTTAEAAPTSSAPLPLSAGALIRQAREDAGLHIAALAVALKVPVKRLEALESDRFDLLPSAVFSRALASSVCRALKLDPAGVLAQLPSLAAPRLDYSDQSRLAPYSSSSASHSLPLWNSLSRPALVGGALLLVAAALLVFLPPFPLNFLKSGIGDAAVVTTTVVPLEATSSPAATPATSEPPLAAAAPVLATAVAPAVATVPVAPAALGPATPALSAAPAADTAKSPTTGLVVFNPTAPSWVEVTDAQGTVLLRRMLAAGEVAGITGALPLSAVVGRADVTRVKVRGQPLDLAPIARDNVARFEVK